METDSPKDFPWTTVPATSPARNLSSMDKAMLGVYCTVAVVGIVGNGLVIYVTAFRMRRSVNSIWFLNLAIADFLFTSFLILISVSLSQGYHWPFGEFMCKFRAILAVSNMFASVFFLTAISVDRCLCTWVVVWSQNHRTVRKTQLVCVGIWLAALACSIPYGHLRKVHEYMGMSLCGLSSSVNTLALTHFLFIVGFLLPMVVITASYVAIGVRISRFPRERSRKSLRITISIILAFAICWLPFHVHKYIEEYASEQPNIRNIRKYLGPISAILTTVNSCLNPVLYVFMCKEFVKNLRRSLFHVLETALTEDYTSFTSRHSLSSISHIFKRSESGPSSQRKNTSTSSETCPRFTASDNMDKQPDATDQQQAFMHETPGPGACETTFYHPV